MTKDTVAPVRRSQRALEVIPHLAVGESVIRYDLGDAIARRAGTPVTPTACGEADVVCTLTTRHVDKVRCRACLRVATAGTPPERRAFLRQVGRGAVLRMPSKEAREYDDSGGYENVDQAIFEAARAGLVRLGGVITDGPYRHPRSRRRRFELTRAGEVAATEPEQEAGHIDE